MKIILHFKEKNVLGYYNIFIVEIIEIEELVNTYYIKYKQGYEGNVMKSLNDMYYSFKKRNEECKKCKYFSICNKCIPVNFMITKKIEYVLYYLNEQIKDCAFYETIKKETNFYKKKVSMEIIKEE